MEDDPNDDLRPLSWSVVYGRPVFRALASQISGSEYESCWGLWFVSVVLWMESFEVMANFALEGITLISAFASFFFYRIVWTSPSNCCLYLLLRLLESLNALHLLMSRWIFILKGLDTQLRFCLILNVGLGGVVF